jgi:hypothetical protein
MNPFPELVDSLNGTVYIRMHPENPDVVLVLCAAYQPFAFSTGKPHSNHLHIDAGMTGNNQRLFDDA